MAARVGGGRRCGSYANGSGIEPLSRVSSSVRFWTSEPELACLAGTLLRVVTKHVNELLRQFSGWLPLRQIGVRAPTKLALSAWRPPVN